VLAAGRRRVAGYVFVDAGLPAPSVAQVPMIPPEFYEMIAGQAHAEGLLPPWTHWWGEADVSVLFPDARTRAVVEREHQRLPLSYFEESVPVPGRLAFAGGMSSEIS
jgi:hypothetical protein